MNRAEQQALLNGQVLRHLPVAPEEGFTMGDLYTALRRSQVFALTGELRGTLEELLAAGRIELAPPTRQGFPRYRVPNDG